jgi:hypothetical protein
MLDGGVVERSYEAGARKRQTIDLSFWLEFEGLWSDGVILEGQSLV